MYTPPRSRVFYPKVAIFIALLSCGYFIIQKKRSKKLLSKDLSLVLERNIKKNSSASLKPEKRTSKSAMKRHEKILHEIETKNPDIVFIGDSITRGLEFQKPTWQEYSYLQTVNAGISSDRIQHMLFRIESGLFLKSKPKLIVLMAGINNITMNSASEIVTGIKLLLDAIQKQTPESRIVLLGLFPSGRSPEMKVRKKIQNINRSLSHIQRDNVQFLDIGYRFLTPSGTLTKKISYDGVHLTGKGYKIWQSAMMPLLRNNSHIF